MKKQKKKVTRCRNESLIVLCVILLGVTISLLVFTSNIISMQQERIQIKYEGDGLSEEGMGSSMEKMEESEEAEEVPIEENLEEVIKERIPLLYQWDDRWGSKEYGAGEMAVTGCGPTCLSMVAMYLLQDVSLTPDWMADYSTDNGYCVPGSGTSWTFMSEGARQLGLYAEEIAPSETIVANYLQEGNPIICIMGPGDFTDGGHFIVLSGWENGLIKINDPNSVANSQKWWTYEEIEGQIRNMWVYFQG